VFLLRIWGTSLGQTLQAMLRLVSRTMEPIVLKTNKQRLREGPLYDGLKYKVIVFFIFASRATGHELPYFERLLRETAMRYGRLDLVAGDAAYLSRANCDLVAALGATPRFYPKKGITLRQRGSVTWRRMFEDLIFDPQKWLEDYHKCSNVEGYFSILKRDNSLPLCKSLVNAKSKKPSPVLVI